MNEAALRDLRRTRQQHRLGNIEWFDAAYHAYLVGLFGGGSVLWISSSVHDSPLNAAATADIARIAPSMVGLLAALVLFAGLRGGVQGGPVALEAADVVHVMLSPVDRRRALLRPALQRVRGAVFMGITAGAIAGQLAGRRLPGSVLAWAGGGALFGATVALLWAGAALLAHTLLVGRRRAPRWLPTLVGLTVVAWQGIAVYAAVRDADGRVPDVPGPADAFGSLALWGWRQQATDLIAVAIAVIAVVFGLALLGRISLEALSRRSALVAQLKFAVTMQDLRTVILLRRQLNQEHTRARPWRSLRSRPRTTLTAAVRRRGAQGLLRFPATRMVRVAALAIAFGVLQAAVVRGTTPAVLLSALVAFVIGLEVMEPLSQEIDQPDRTDSYPIERGELLVRHLFAPTLALLPLAVIAGGAAILTLGTTDAIVPAAILSAPNLIAGAVGGVVSIVRDAPDPFTADRQQSFVPPEIAGFSTMLRLIWPLVVSGLGCSTIFIVRAASNADSSLAESSLSGAAVRGALGSLLLTALVVYWVKVRDRVRRRFRAFMAAGRAQAAAA